MDTVAQAFYELRFENSFLKKKGTEFQNFFSEIMEKSYPGDFQKIKPWGKSGDRKNDGYLKSKRMICQVYAPNEMTAKETIKKIEEDFEGAKANWADHFDTWVFVHNSYDGIGPDIEKALLQLQKDNTDYHIDNWGFEELRRVFVDLDMNAMQSIFGFAPTGDALKSIGFEELQIVLNTIQDQDIPGEPDLRPVSSYKISYNKLSKNSEILLTAGMTKASLVENFFAKWSDPTFGDKIAGAFNKKYIQLRDAGLLPDNILMELQIFAGGSRQGPPAYQAAVLAVLAHLFEKCDIFERVVENHDSANKIPS